MLIYAIINIDSVKNNEIYELSIVESYRLVNEDKMV